MESSHQSTGRSAGHSRNRKAKPSSHSRQARETSRSSRAQRERTGRHQTQEAARTGTRGKVIPFPRLARRTAEKRSTDRKTAERRPSEKKVRRRLSANVGAMTIGTMSVVLANVVGVGELLIGMVAAYTAYRAIRYKIPPTEAILEGIELEHGEIPRRSSEAA